MVRRNKPQESGFTKLQILQIRVYALQKEGLGEEARKLDKQVSRIQRNNIEALNKNRYE